MNRLAHWMMRLYPSRWRRRYGDEVRALVDDSGADIRVLADLFKGALVMQFSAWSFPRLAAALGLAGMLAGFGVTMLSPAPYVARTELNLSGTDSRGATMQVLQMETTTRRSLSAVINDPRLLLYRDQIRTLPLEDVIVQMRKDIAFRLDGDRDIAIQFSYPERAKAEMAVRELAKQAARKLEQRAGFEQLAGPQPPSLEIVDTPNLPSWPLRPNPWLTALTGLTAGCLIAFVWFASARFILSRRIRGFSRTAWTLAITGMLAGAAMSWVIPAVAGRLPAGLLPLRYESHATLYEADNAIPLGDVAGRVSSRTAMAGIIADPRLQLYSRELDRQSLDEVAAAMKRDVALTERGSGPGERWLDISFTCTDPFKAQQAVYSIMRLAEDEFHRSVSQQNPARRQIRWGSIAGPPPAVTVDSIATGRATPMLTGFVIGLSLAAIIAIVRQRWTGDDDVLIPQQTVYPPIASTRRFLKLAPWLTVTGAVSGFLFVWFMPGRYTAETVVAFENEPPSQAATLINDVVNRYLSGTAKAGRNLSWEQLEAENTKSGTFRIGFVAGSPEHAREVLQDVLGEIDRAVVRQQSAFTPSFEEIRGVDGVLLTDPPQGVKQGTVVPATISFDDERARPVSRPPGAEIRMNVIDQPAALSGSDGPGFWAIAIGAATGVILAWLLSLFGNFRTWPGLRRTTTTNPSY